MRTEILRMLVCFWLGFAPVFADVTFTDSKWWIIVVPMVFGLLLFESSIRKDEREMRDERA